jgi:hypothetical protein
MFVSRVEAEAPTLAAEFNEVRFLWKDQPSPGSPAMRKVTLSALLISALVGFLPKAATGQDADPALSELQAVEDQVVAVVAQLFEGMKARDGELLKSLFHPDALMTSTGMREGSYRVSMSPPDGWIESVSSFTGGVIDERFYNPVVEVSGPLASVWTEYDLFVNEEFRHCGVDAFHLALTDDGWKIVHVADTRMTSGCPSR